MPESQSYHSFRIYIFSIKIKQKTAFNKFRTLTPSITCAAASFPPLQYLTFSRSKISFSFYINMLAKRRLKYKSKSQTYKDFPKIFCFFTFLHNAESRGKLLHSVRILKSSNNFFCPFEN